MAVWESNPAACCGVVDEFSRARGAGFKDSVARDHSQTGVTLEAQTGNIFSQIPLLLVPEFPLFVI